MIWLTIVIAAAVYYIFRRKWKKKQEKLPPLGRQMRKQFCMDKDYIPLNHGSFGNQPKCVVRALHKFQDRASRQADLWYRREYKAELHQIRASLATLVNAFMEDVTIVQNTTSGINAILRSKKFNPGDLILTFNTIFSATKGVVQYVVDSSEGTVSHLVFSLTYPSTNDAIINQLENFLETNTKDPTSRIRIAIVDHISSTPAVRLPLEQIIPMLKKRKIEVLVDAAHAIGQVTVDICGLAPDYYVTNCHKWLYTARGCALLYVDKKHQAAIHPANIAMGYKQIAEFPAEFEWTGTMDFSSYMSVPAALKFRETLGGEKVIMKYTHNLAVAGGKLVAQRLNTRVLQSEDQIASMVDVQLPVDNPDNPKLTAEWWVDEQLHGRHTKTFAAVYKHNGAWWARLSAQIYNDESDFEEGAKHLLAICKELNNSAPAIGKP